MNSLYRQSVTGAQGPYGPTQQVVIPQITVPTTGVQRWEPLTCKGQDAAYRMYTPPGVRVPIFDEEEECFYYKETDQYGNIVSFDIFDYHKREKPPAPSYVTLEEFNKFKEEMLNGKSVRTQSE